VFLKQVIQDQSYAVRVYQEDNGVVNYKRELHIFYEKMFLI